jgi:trehalose 6-phosphate phosphatase
MQDILSPAGLNQLRSFFYHRPLVVFDFDGTLAPLLAQRGEVRASDLTRALVGRLSQWIPVGVVSGRRLSDLAERFRGMDRVLMAGNHGGERLDDSDTTYVQRAAMAAEDVKDFLKELSRLELLQAMPEQVIENKGLSLTFHWRGADPELVRKWAQEVRRVAAESGNFRLIPGIQSLSVVPRDLSDKGDAVLGLLEAARRTHLVYLGDEETDEDVFRKAAGEKFLGIRVGRSESSAAAWYVSSQSEVDRVLEIVLALVARPAIA